MRLSAIYDTLTVLEGGAAAPALVKSWTASADATEWTFVLREDATFSDGKRVTAADALYSIRRGVEKAAENGGRFGTIDIDRSKAVDDHTLRLVTAMPDAELPLTLTLGSFVVPEGATDFAKPVGSGAFVLKQLDDQAAVLEARQEWWGGTPGVGTIEIRGFADAQAMGQAITTGSLDVASGVQPATAKASEGTDIRVSVSPGTDTVPLLLRVDTEPFDDQRVREAIKLALDRPALVEQVYLGYGRVGRDMIRLDEPGVPANVPEVRRDVERAKQLLAQAGHPNGFTTVLHTSGAYPAMLPLATLAKEQLREVGITVEIQEHAPDQYWTTAYTVKSFTVGYYSGSASFGTLVRATMLSSSAYSETGWKDAAFDAAYAKAMSTPDPAQRAELVADLHRRMAAEGGWVVWGFGDRITLHGRHVQGLTTHGNRHDLSKITIGG